jgi:Na+/glutamate symporter
VAGPEVEFVLGRGVAIPFFVCYLVVSIVCQDGFRFIAKYWIMSL